MGLKTSLVTAAYAIAPRSAGHLDRWWWDRKLARALVAEAARCRNAVDLFDAVRNSQFFPEQNRSEMCRLMELLRVEPPRRVCEIGAGRGGNLFLIAQMSDPAAHFISIDIRFSFARPNCLARLGKARQRIDCVEADSQSAATRDRVESLLSGHSLDLLFIDGDHSYAGVKRDFDLYYPLVRSGGLVALHDIVPDFRTRYGQDTGTYTGEVPVFWNELKAQHTDYLEFIDDPNQDGLGIGVIRKDG
ncbi:MAG: class I SAM-dependent methyltransferase [bacterium]